MDECGNSVEPMNYVVLNFLILLLLCPSTDSTTTIVENKKKKNKNKYFFFFLTHIHTIHLFSFFHFCWFVYNIIIWRRNTELSSSSSCRQFNYYFVVNYGFSILVYLVFFSSCIFLFVCSTTEFILSSELCRTGITATNRRKNERK